MAATTPPPTSPDSTQQLGMFLPSFIPPYGYGFPSLYALYVPQTGFLNKVLE